MTINFDEKKEAILKNLLGVDDLTPIIEKLLSDWAANIIETKYRPQKTDDDIISELNIKLK
jgi:hypothetical protein